MISVSVPATSANLGVGYDVLGLALDLKARFTFETSTQKLEIVGDDPDFANEQNLIYQAFATSTCAQFKDYGRFGHPQFAGLGELGYVCCWRNCRGKCVVSCRLGSDSAFEACSENGRASGQCCPCNFWSAVCDYFGRYRAHCAPVSGQLTVAVSDIHP